MRTDIKNILEELYALEPDLRSKEAEITPIIERMIKSKPKVQMDETFRAELKAKILAEIHTRSAKTSWLSWSLPFAGGVLACGLLGAFVWQSNILEPVPLAATQISFRPTITPVSNASLGKITLAAANTRPQSGGGGMGGAEMAMVNTAPPTVAVAPTNNPVADGDAAVLGTDEAISSKRMASDMMIYPPIDMPIYNYVYTGDLTLPAQQQTVYRRNPVAFDWQDTANVIKSFSIDNLDLGNFRNLGVSNINLVEDRDFGYMVSVDFQNGNISMYQNWLRWPQPKCDQNGCEQLKPLTEKNIPADSVMIAAADDFLADYGVSTEGYGEPVVDASWRVWYARSMADGQEGYIPEIYNIIYPLLVDGQEIKEEGGMAKGITLSYDIRTKRITNMYGLEKQNLQKTEYAPITDKTVMEQMLKNGGRYIYTNQPADTSGRKVVDINLGEPKLTYVHIYGEWKNGRSEEYYVPAYIFPVMNAPTDAYYMQNQIVVPLVQEFVQTIDYQPMDPIIYSDMPVAEPAVKEEALSE